MHGFNSNYVKLQEVFGDNRLFWFVPMFTSFGDGVVFPQRGQLDEEAGLLGGQSPTGSSSNGGHNQVPGGVYAVTDEEERMPMLETSTSLTAKTSSSSSEEVAARSNGSVSLMAPSSPEMHKRGSNGDLVSVSM